MRMLTGDAREVLATLPDESVHCVVTSPPYWGLRAYGGDSWEGGNPDRATTPTNREAGVLCPRSYARGRPKATYEWQRNVG